MKRVRLTDAGIRRLKPGTREYTVRDARVPALGVRVLPSGTRTFVCHYPNTKASLGPALLLTVEEARRDCLQRLSGGPDRQNRAPMFAAFATGPWRESRIPRCKPSTIRWRDWVLNAQLLPNFGTLRMDRITPAQIHSWFDAYSRTSPGGANIALNLLRQILNHAVKYGFIGVNPARSVAPNPRPKRTRFLGREEIVRLHAVLDRHAAGRRGQQADIIRLLLLTGCRKNEIVRLKRREVDGGRLRLEDSKTGPRTVFLNPSARAIIDRRLSKASGAFVFPSPRDPARPISDSLTLWTTVRREAEIEDVRLHDLRHTYASQAVMQGAPLPVVARLLGHRKVTMTLRYAHADDREIAAAAERVGTTISEWLGLVSASNLDPDGPHGNGKTSGPC